MRKTANLRFVEIYTGVSTFVLVLIFQFNPSSTFTKIDSHKSKREIASVVTKMDDLPLVSHSRVASQGGFETPKLTVQKLPHVSLKPRRMSEHHLKQTILTVPMAADDGTGVVLRTPNVSYAPQKAPPCCLESLVHNAPKFPSMFSPLPLLLPSEAATTLPPALLPKKRIKRSRDIIAAMELEEEEVAPPARGQPIYWNEALLTSNESKPLDSSVFLPDIPNIRSTSPGSCLNFPHEGGTPMSRRRLKMRPQSSRSTPSSIPLL